MGKYSIRDLEKVTGVKAHTIRIWEQRYGLVSPERSETNIRSYSDEDLKKLMNIAVLNQNGYKISKLASLSNEQLTREVLDLNDCPDNRDSKVTSMLLAMMELDEMAFHKIFNASVKQTGFERTFRELILPTLHQAGMLWQAGTLNPAQEHFFSALVRQKLIMATHQEDGATGPQSKVFLMFLPEGDWHELGLLFLSYLVKKYGHKSIYLGQSTPVEAVNEIVHLHQPDFVVISLVTSLSADCMDTLVKSLDPQSARLIIHGPQASELDGGAFRDAIILESYDQFISLLQDI